MSYQPQHRHSNHRTSEPGRLAKNFDLYVDRIDDNPSSTNPLPATPLKSVKVRRNTEAFSNFVNSIIITEILTLRKDGCRKEARPYRQEAYVPSIEIPAPPSPRIIDTEYTNDRLSIIRSAVGLLLLQATNKPKLQKETNAKWNQ